MSPCERMVWYCTIGPSTLCHRGRSSMRRIVACLVIVGVALALSFGAGLRAAAKAYQFTGTVKASDGGALTVEKSAKETWTFTKNKKKKGTPKAGDKGNVYANI